MHRGPLLGGASVAPDGATGGWRIEFMVKLPPSANSQYAVRRGRLVPTTKKMQFRRCVSMLLLGVTPPPEDAKLRFTIAAVMNGRDFAVRDLDNVIKPTIDAVTQSLGVNDVRILEIVASKQRGDAAESVLRVVMEAI